MDGPDSEWKPNNRPQSTVARNFLTELDDLFKINGDLDSLDKNVHEKKQAVSTHTQELEALEARLKATEERLKQAKTSPPNFKRKDSQRRTPVEGTFPDQDLPRQSDLASPSTQKQNRQRPNAATQRGNDTADRPRSARSASDEDEA